jgi:hypothetical protein
MSVSLNVFFELYVFCLNMLDKPLAEILGIPVLRSLFVFRFQSRNMSSFVEVMNSVECNHSNLNVAFF